MAEKGLIFDFQGFSVHDGPGCRTVIFFKGCPLHCRWCSNPEGIKPEPELIYYPNRCRGDLECLKVCPCHAVSPLEGKPVFKREKCLNCDSKPCIEACSYQALQCSGEHVGGEELLGKIRRDRQYWGSRGGVTLSGGEPMAQFCFIKSLLKSCYDAYIHTALETCGFAPWEHFRQVLPYLEWIFFDLKHLNDESHREATGAGNRQILENARRLAENEKNYRLMFRLPLIKNFNDDPQSLRQIAKFLRELGKREINLLPQHHLGAGKYQSLGLDYPYPDFKLHSPDELATIVGIMAKNGVTAYLGSDTPF